MGSGGWRGGERLAVDDRPEAMATFTLRLVGDD